MLNLNYDLKTNITIIAAYFPILGLIITFLLAKQYSGKTKWLILSLGPVLLFTATCLVWGFWASKVIYKSASDPFYISMFLQFFYLAGHYAYLFKRLVIHFFKKRKKSNPQ